MEELAGASAGTGDVWVSAAAAGDEFEFDSSSFESPCESLVRLFFSSPPKLGIGITIHRKSSRLKAKLLGLKINGYLSFLLTEGRWLYLMVRGGYDGMRSPSPSMKQTLDQLDGL